MQVSLLKRREVMNNDDKVVYSSIGILIVGSVWIGGQVSAGIFTALISTVGVGMIFVKIKGSSPRTWDYMMRHPIMMDILFSVVLGFLLINQTVTGIISAAAAGLFVSAGIGIASKFHINEYRERT
jgi:hypothetical protein